jgi:hypothetical protein
MALSITQLPATASLAQSPIVFAVSESSAALIGSSSFQYVMELFIWSGSQIPEPTVSDYTLLKYPNASKIGIFEVSQIMNSTLRDLAQEVTSSTRYFYGDFYTQFKSGSSFVTGSHIQSNTFTALDGFAIFQEPIGQQIFQKSTFWPILTDGPVTQSYFSVNRGEMGVYTAQVGSTPPTRMLYSGSNGANAVFTLSTAANTNGQIKRFPTAPQQSGFPISTVGLEWFTVQPSAAQSPLGNRIRFELACENKYPNVRLKWKNRYGQFDWLNCNGVSQQSFDTTKRTYQPQLGSFNGTSLAYNSYDSQNLNYIADSKQTLIVNTNWLDEDYNDILKQLFVSDEIYWVYNEAQNQLRPITIQQSSIQFKTGVVDKVIQYTFAFDFGQGYKLII